MLSIGQQIRNKTDKVFIVTEFSERERLNNYKPLIGLEILGSAWGKKQKMSYRRANQW